MSRKWFVVNACQDVTAVVSEVAANSGGKMRLTDRNDIVILHQYFNTSLKQESESVQNLNSPKIRLIPDLI